MEDLQKSDTAVLKDNIATIFAGLCKIFDEYGQIKKVNLAIVRPMDSFILKKHIRETACVFSRRTRDDNIVTDFWCEGEEIRVPFIRDFNLSVFGADEFKDALMKGLVQNSTYDVYVAIRRGAENPEEYSVAIAAVNHIR